MKMSIKYWVIDGFILWPFLSMSLFLVKLIFQPDPWWFESWDITLTAILYYTSLSMVYQILLYLFNALILISLRRVFYRIDKLAAIGYALIFGSLVGVFSFFFCRWLNQSVIMFYENIFQEYYFAFAFALIGGLFFLLGQRRKIKTEAH
jgi:hypothetical protein